jgi:receptor protein-tyrosine kinase
MLVSSLIEKKSDADQNDIVQRHNRPIGVLLVEAGALARNSVDMVQLHQKREKDVLFGQAAVKLGLVTQRDVDRALARQFDVDYLIVGDSNISSEIFAAYHPSAPETEALRRLRTTLLMMHFDRDIDARALAITSAHRLDGRSVLAANLAVMFAQIGKRTLLIDADLRNPRQHELFGFKNPKGLSSILANRDSTEIIEHVGDLNNLFVLPAGISPPSPQDLIGRSIFPMLINELGKQFDIVLIDTPPANKYSDAHIISAAAGNALVVARDNFSQVAAVQEMAESFAQSGVNLLGSVLNKF